MEVDRGRRTVQRLSDWVYSPPRAAAYPGNAIQGSSAGFGGAVAVFRPAQLGGNTLQGNRANATWGGGAVYIQNADVEVGSNTFDGNQSPNGGAVSLVCGAQARLTDNTFRGNQATETDTARGGAVFAGLSAAVLDAVGNPWARVNVPPAADPTNTYGTGLDANSPEDVHYASSPLMPCDQVP